MQDFLFLIKVFLIKNRNSPETFFKRLIVSSNSEVFELFLLKNLNGLVKLPNEFKQCAQVPFIFTRSQIYYNKESGDRYKRKSLSFAFVLILVVPYLFTNALRKFTENFRKAGSRPEKQPRTRLSCILPLVVVLVSRPSYYQQAKQI